MAMADLVLTKKETATAYARKVRLQTGIVAKRLTWLLILSFALANFFGSRQNLWRAC
jgi:hypothetical protein